jgi:hypothetical protein
MNVFEIKFNFKLFFDENVKIENSKKEKEKRSKEK